MALIAIGALSLTAWRALEQPADAAIGLDTDPYADLVMDFETAPPEDADEAESPDLEGGSAAPLASASQTDSAGLQAHSAAAPEDRSALASPTALTRKVAAKNGPRSRRSRATDRTAHVEDPTQAAVPTSLGALFDSNFGGVKTDVNRGTATPLRGAAVGRAIQQQLNRYQRTDVRRCYEQRLKSSPDLTGSWSVRFTVKSDGTTQGAAVHRKKGSDVGFEHCLLRAAAQWRFPTIDAAIEVQKTFALAPREP